MFRLWAWDQIPAGLPSLNMNAIVGRAFTTQTPVFVDDMEHVVFRPYWNVPPSILTKEILPIVARDPRYLEREALEIVRGFGTNVEVLPVTTASLRLLRTGVARLRQRPGARNPLGLIEFLFPNDANVYMHGTPMPELFTHARRDFSHGCIRVEDPVALAAWVLQGQDDWTRERILAATEGPDDVRVDLARTIRVVIFYTTAAVMPEDAAVHFADDIYGHDAVLDRALRARQTPAGPH
jgi:murein L,D-transpeptidase YcbB/YkuD